MPVLSILAAAPLAAASVTGDIQFPTAPTTATNTKSYTFNISLTSSTPITSLAIRFSITSSNATYATSQATVGCWTPTVGPPGVNTTVTYTYTCTPFPTSVGDTTFTLVRANNPSGSTVQVDLLVSGQVTDTQTFTFP